MSKYRTGCLSFRLIFFNKRLEVLQSTLATLVLSLGQVLYSTGAQQVHFAILSRSKAPWAQADNFLHSSCRPFISFSITLAR